MELKGGLESIDQEIDGIVMECKTEYNPMETPMRVEKKVEESIRVSPSDLVDIREDNQENWSGFANIGNENSQENIAEDIQKNEEKGDQIS